MPAKKAGGRKRKVGGAKRPSARSKMVLMQNGEGFFGDLWDGIKSVGKKIVSNVKPSQILSLIPHPGAQTVGRVAGAVGLGKRRRAPRRQAGGAMAGRLYLV